MKTNLLLFALTAICLAPVCRTQSGDTPRREGVSRCVINDTEVHQAEEQYIFFGQK